MRLTKAPLKAKKRKNNVVHDEFIVSPGAGPNEGNFVCTCKHCHEIAQIAKVVNVSKLIYHLTVICKSTPENIKESVTKSTQRAKKQQKTSKLIPSSGKSLGAETIGDVRKAVEASAPSPYKSSSSQSLSQSPLMSKKFKHQTGMAQFGQLMTKEMAEKMLRFDVESMLVRFEPPSRLNDPFVRAAILNKSPGLGPFLISPEYAVNVIAPAIDRELIDEINTIVASSLGDANYSVDGVTVNSRSNLLITRSVASLTNFVDMVQLGDEVHVTNAEASAVCAIIEADMSKLVNRRVSSVRLSEKFEVASVAVDNAASAMAKQVRRIK